MGKSFRLEMPAWTSDRSDGATAVDTVHDEVALSEDEVIFVCLMIKNNVEVG